MRLKRGDLVVWTGVISFAECKRDVGLVLGRDEDGFLVVQWRHDGELRYPRGAMLRKVM